jgi:hypothetical protein
MQPVFQLDPNPIRPLKHIDDSQNGLRASGSAELTPQQVKVRSRANRASQGINGNRGPVFDGCLNLSSERLELWVPDKLPQESPRFLIPDLLEDLQHYRLSGGIRAKQSFVAADQAGVVASDSYKQVPNYILRVLGNALFDAVSQSVRSQFRMGIHVVIEKLIADARHCDRL